MPFPDARYVSKYTSETYNAMEVQRDGYLTEHDRAWNLCHGPRNYQALGSSATTSDPTSSSNSQS